MSASIWNPGDAVLVWALNVLLQVCVIAAVALVIGRTLRRSSAARYWLLCSALMLVLLCPLMAAAVQSTGMSLVSVSMVQEEVAVIEEPINSAEVTALPTDEVATPEVHTDTFESDVSWQTDFATDVEQPLRVIPSELPGPLNADVTTAAIATESIATTPGIDTAPSISVAPGSTTTRWGIVLRTLGPWLLLAWVAVSLVLLTRLVVAWYRLAKILSNATPNNDEGLAESFRKLWPLLAGSSDRRIPQLAFSDRISGPIAAGIRSPKVVLPESLGGKISAEQLRDILIHEVAHIARGDQVVVLLQNIAAAVFWIHPLVRMLNRALAQAREEVCDNYVLAATDAPSYSRTLLTLAQVLDSSRAVPGAVGLFASRWKLEERVAGLLDEQRSRVTRLSKTALSLIAVAAVTLGIMTAFGTISIAGSSSRDDAETKQGATDESETTTAVDSEDTITVRGTVLKPDGSPAAGATIRAAVSMYADLKRILGPDFETPMETAVADEEGRFRVAVHRNPFGDVDVTGTRYTTQWKETHIAATLDGFGGDWVVFKNLDDGEDVTLSLVEDQPIRGRVIDLEGNPIQGVSIKVTGLQASESADLSKWVEAVRAGESPQTSHTHASRFVSLRVAGIETELTTDVEGRFELRNIGRERIVRLNAVGETAAFENFRVVSRDLEPLTMSIFSDETERVYGCDFVLSVSPSQPVTGVVVDAETKQPLPGVQVEAYRFAGSMLAGRDEIVTTTDSEGRFRLIGFPKAQPKAKRGRRHNYVFFRPNDDQPYLMRRLQVPISEGLDEIQITAELHRGTWITGRVTDKVTGEGVGGVRMYYLAYRSNKFAQALPEFDDDGNVQGDQTRYQTNAEGYYRLVGLPGPALIGAESIATPYRYGGGFDDLGIPEEESTFGLFYRNPINPTPKWPNSVVRINPPQDVESFETNVVLDPGASIELKVVDADDQLVEGASLRGLSARFGGSTTTDDRAYEVTNLTPDENRVIIAHHARRGIGRVARVKPEHVEKGRMRIRLQECVTVTGRLTDEGKPLTGIRIEPRILPGGDFSKSLDAFTTDSEGHFAGTLLPGTQYNLFAEGNGLDFFATVADKLPVIPGNDIDLGTLTLTDDRKFVRDDKAGAVKHKGQSAPIVEESRLSQPAVDGDEHSITVDGTVTDESGKPIAGAAVAAIGRKVVPERASTTDVLAEQLTDESGRFQLSIRGASSKTHQYSSVIAVADGMGITFERLDLDRNVVASDLQMKPEELIRVKLVDIEGQPAANLPVQLSAIMVPPTSGVGLRDVVLKSRPDFGNLRTDENGLLTIKGIAGGHGVWLKIDGTDMLAPQDIALNTGQPEERGERDATYRSLVKNMKPGEVGTLALAPARLFEGVVLLGDTGKPAVGVKVSVGSSQQAVGGSMSSVQGTTDENGRFRINAQPGVRFRIAAHPPKGSAFQIRTLDDLKWDSGESSKNIKIKLPAGLLYRGTVVDAVTTRPLQGAFVQYIPDRLHNDNITPGVITGWQGIQQTHADGRFSISVFPGPGTLLVHAPNDGSYVLQESTRRELEGQTGGQRMYAHAFHKISPVAGKPISTNVIALTPGKTVVPRLVDEAGNPIDEAVVVSRLRISPLSSYWRAFGGNALSGRLDVPGLEDGKDYETYFLAPKRKLGATVQLSTDDLNPTIELSPCGSATATIIDQNGDPIADNGSYGLHIVARPGPSRLDVRAMRRGEIVADEDFAANVDRMNHGELKTDANGDITFPALIPGATYRLNARIDGKWQVVEEFEVESGKAYDMGRIEIPIAEE